MAKDEVFKIKYALEKLPDGGLRAWTTSPPGVVVSAPSAEGAKRMFLTHAGMLKVDLEKKNNSRSTGWSLKFPDWDETLAHDGVGVGEMRLEPMEVPHDISSAREAREVVNDLIEKGKVGKALEDDNDPVIDAFDYAPGSDESFPRFENLSVRCVENSRTGDKIWVGVAANEAKDDIYDAEWIGDKVEETKELIENWKNRSMIN